MDVDFTEVTKCQCGALSVVVDGQLYSMSAETFKKRYGFEIFGEWVNCNHCINHWGIDLCACGSGKSPDNCDGGFDECGHPNQTLRHASKKKSSKESHEVRNMEPNTKRFLEIIQTDKELFDKYFDMVQELKEKIATELLDDVSKYPTVESTDVEYGELTKQIVTKLKWAQARKGYTGISIF